jgi:hypothetical protein
METPFASGIPHRGILSKLNIYPTGVSNVNPPQKKTTMREPTIGIIDGGAAGRSDSRSQIHEWSRRLDTPQNGA